MDIKNVTIYKFEVYTGSEELRTLKLIHSDVRGLGKDVDLPKFAAYLKALYKGDEVTCATLYENIKIYTKRS